MNRQTLSTEVIAELIGETKAKIEQLQAELAAEKLVLAAFEKRMAAIDRLTVPQPPPVSDSHRNGQHPAVQTESGRILEPGRMPEMLDRIFREAGGPLRVPELVRRVEATGFKTDAKKGTKSIVFSTLSRRRDLFARVGSGVYDLAPGVRSNTNGR